MIVLPHLLIRQYLKNEFERLRNTPEELECLLSSYRHEYIAEDYGNDYIAKAIQWFMEHEFFIVLGSRLDIDKLPSIAVTYEGGTETDQFIGDQAVAQRVTVQPARYAEFSIKDIDDGALIVSASENIEKRVWVGLILRNGTFSSKIKSIVSDGADVRIELADAASLEDVELQNWEAFSFVDKKRRNLGSSGDQASVRIFLSIPGDPELAEMMSTILRYTLKRSRPFLESNNFYELRYSHSALSRSADFDESQVWVIEYTVSGLLLDHWILSEHRPGDKVDVCIDAATSDPEDEEVRL